MEYFCRFGTKIELSIMIKKNVGVVGNGKWAKIMLPKIAKFANIKFIANTKTGYKKFNLNEKEIKMHTDSIQIALNNTPNGKIVSWHNGDRLSSGKVRVVKTYYKNDRYCRIFQSYIKLNGAKKHNTKHVCQVDNIWKF